MRRYLFNLSVFVLLLSVSVVSIHGAPTKAPTLTCVGIYSETSDGSVSYRVGTGKWVVVKVGDVIPADAEVRINVERDWIEVIPSDKPNTVYEIAGIPTGEVLKKVADILKGKSRTVNFPKAGKSADAKYKNKLVVTQYWGRQIYIDADYNEKDIKYGDVLDRKGKINIIAINNTLVLMNDKGETTTIIGPLKFDVEKVLTNQNLYKFLNVHK